MITGKLIFINLVIAIFAVDVDPGKYKKHALNTIYKL